MINRINAARADTLITQASGEALARLSEFYGFSWPKYIPEEDWRQALRRAVFSAKGTSGVLFDFLLAMFKQWSTVSTIRGTALAGGTEIELDQDSIDFSDNGNYVGRLALIRGKFYFSTGVDNGVLGFADCSTSMFSAADFVVGEEYEISLLPFLLEEHGCKVNLVLDGGIFVVPSTYLQQDGTFAQNIGEPPYGFIMDFFSQITAERFGKSTGPYPAYLATDFFESNFFGSIFKLLAAGVQLKVQNIQWYSDAISMYSDFTTLLNTGSAQQGDYSVVLDRV